MSFARYLTKLSSFLNSSGQVQQAAIAGGVAGTGPAFSAYQSVLVSILTSFVKIPLQVEQFDTASAFDSSVNYRFQPLVAGYYQMSAGLQAAGGAYSIRAAIYKNGAVEFYSSSAVPGAAAQVSGLLYLNGSTDYVELFGLSATAQNSSVGVGLTYMTGFLARAA